MSQGSDDSGRLGGKTRRDFFRTASTLGAAGAVAGVTAGRFRFNSGEPGIGLEVARWVVEKDLCLTGADTWAVEAVPNRAVQGRDRLAGQPDRDNLIARGPSGHVTAVAWPDGPDAAQPGVAPPCRFAASSCAAASSASRAVTLATDGRSPMRFT